MESLLAGRVIAVTGAARGLGRSYVQALCAAGASVVASDVEESGLAETQELVEADGGTAVSHVDDVARPSAGEDLVAAAIRAFGRLDGVVANAGVVSVAPVFDQDLEIARRVFEVNVLGTVDTVVPAMRYFRDSGTPGSVVVDTSSARFGGAGRAVYGASKAASASLGLTWAIEGEPYGIRVNVVSPLAATQMTTDTGFDPATHGRVEQIGPLVVYLMSADSEGVTGQVFRHSGDLFGWFGPGSVLATSERRGEWDAATIAGFVADHEGRFARPPAALRRLTDPRG